MSVVRWCLGFLRGDLMTLLPPRAPAGLVGRAAELDRAVSALTTDSVSPLWGPQVSARRRWRASCRCGSRPRRTCVVWLTATEAGRHVPFGALAALIPASSVGQHCPAGRPRDAAGPGGAGRQIDLVVDDAHLLDGPSAAVLLSLTGQVRTVVTVCSGTAHRMRSPRYGRTATWSGFTWNRSVPRTPPTSSVL